MNMAIVGFMAAGLLTGLLVPLQLAFNAQLARETTSPLVAAFLIFAIGMVAMAAVIVVLRPELPAVIDLLDVPPTAWLGGVIATGYVVAIVFVTPKLGVGMTVALIMLGQLLTSTLLNAVGGYGNPQIPIDEWRIFGLVSMIVGVLAIKARDISQFWQ